METIKLYIPSISCGHCAHTIKMELTEMNGVKTVEVDVAQKNAVVEFTDPATTEKITELLKEINYPVERIIE